MPRETSPAFQFYPQDFLSDRHVMAMNASARGCYIVLLCHCWLHGSIPNDWKVIQRLSQYEGHHWPLIREMLKPCFIFDNGELRQPRIERERKKQADYRAMKAKAGQAGGKQTASKRLADMVAESSPPSSSSSSSSIPVLVEQAKEKELASTTSGAPQKPLSQTQKDHATRLAMADSMRRPYDRVHTKNRSR